MKKHLFVILFSAITTLSLSAQTEENNKIDPFDAYNYFQNYSETNVDSAVFYIRHLAADTTWGKKLLPDLIHKSFVQNLKNNLSDQKTKIPLQILDSISMDSNEFLKENTIPILYWVKARQLEDDTAALSDLAKEFISTQLTSDDVYKYSRARYALLIHNILQSNKSLEDINNNIFSNTLEKLKVKAKQNIDVNTATNPQMQARAYHRYLYAYCNYIAGNKIMETNDIEKAEIYHKEAFDYSPDISDILHRHGFAYDMHMLGIEDYDLFKKNYVEYVEQHLKDMNKSLTVRTSMTLIHPVQYKDELESFYKENFADDIPFSEYWHDNVNKNLEEIPEFVLIDEDGKEFSRKTNQGKWIFLDFWGTWCGPCIAEHPDLEDFYTNTIKSNSDKIVLLTIGCHDTKERINAHMQKHSYTFPVMMENNDIQNILNIKSWPTKLLITPQGKYVNIPFAIDWRTFIKKYVGI